MPRLIGHQIDLLGGPDVPVFGRTLRVHLGTDRAKEEGAVATAAKHRYIVLTALKQLRTGSKDQIAARCALTGIQVCRRLTELEHDGLIKPTGRTVPSAAGRQEREWELVGNA
jgi:hypothetical protein